MDLLRGLEEGEPERYWCVGRGDRLILESIEAGAGEECEAVIFQDWVDTRPTTNISVDAELTDINRNSGVYSSRIAV